MTLHHSEGYQTALLKAKTNDGEVDTVVREKTQKQQTKRLKSHN